jgi:hypothetical protein
VSNTVQFHHLVKALGRRHRSLDRQAANVLPSLLKQRHEVVDGQHDVGDQFILGHANVSDGNTHAENLLKLELDGGLDLIDLAAQVLVVGDGSREFTSLRETGTQETRDLLDQGVLSLN